jgi:hypothetical protein
MNSYPEFVLKYLLNFKQWDGRMRNIKQYLSLYNKHYKDVQTCFYFRENMNNNLIVTNRRDNKSMAQYSVLH